MPRNTQPSAYFHIPTKKSTLAASGIVSTTLTACALAAPFLSLSLLWISVVIIGYIIYCLRLSATSLTLTTTLLTINTRLGRIHIPLQDIKEVQIIDNLDLGWKLLPILTLWGRNGEFRTPLLGQFTAYIGNSSLRKTRIILNNKAIVVALNDPDEFKNRIDELADFNVET